MYIDCAYLYNFGLQILWRVGIMFVVTAILMRIINITQNVCKRNESNYLVHIHMNLQDTGAVKKDVTYTFLRQYR